MTITAREILVRYERCLGCRSCELACAVAHSQSGTLAGALQEAKRPQKRVFVEQAGRFQVPVACRHCRNPRCVEVCATGALRRTPEGLVLNTGSSQTCIGCWTCIAVCPYGAIRADYDAGVIVKCDRTCLDEEGLPACVQACPTKALVFATTEEYARTKRHEMLDRLLPTVE